ncbi:response regulator transcription factor [candidate division KSB1 bacterium]|nr:response regulator transcription factor [candidate division KSB1 bacterium]
MAKTILIVDDEQDIIDLLDYNLKAEGYFTLKAMDGNQAIEKAVSSKPDLIILDVMLPGKDGWEVIRELGQNKKTQNIPVIFLTAKDSEIDEILGLELGADDYLVKPISIRKLLVRVKTALRKTKINPEPDDTIQLSELVIDPQKFKVNVAGNSVVLTKKEFEILYFLAKRPGRVITRETLLDAIWGHDVIVVDRTIDVHIRKIREKFGQKFENMIETIKGVGYRLKAD